MLKKIILVIICVFVVLGAAVVFKISYYPISHEKLGFLERYTLDRINKNLDKCIGILPKEEQKKIAYERIGQCLNPLEKKLAYRILSIDPRSLGFKGPYFSMDPVSGLILIPDKEFDVKGEKYNTGINFVPGPAFSDFEKMNEAMEKEINKKLFVDSAYRSPGYQGMLFLFYLGEENQYSLLENAKWVAMPGYSEHGAPNIAIDFINENGISGEGKGQVAEDFEKLPEFTWLKTNASQFNFYLTYPPGNPHGIGYEPWHWHWEKK